LKLSLDEWRQADLEKFHCLADTFVIADGQVLLLPVQIVRFVLVISDHRASVNVRDQTCIPIGKSASHSQKKPLAGTNTEFSAANLNFVYSVKKRPDANAFAIHVCAAGASEVMNPHFAWKVENDCVTAAHIDVFNYDFVRGHGANRNDRLRKRQSTTIGGMNDNHVRLARTMRKSEPVLLED